MNETLKVLYTEHENIIDAIEVARMSAPLIETDAEEYRVLVKSLLNFFRQYGDAFHHQKEEHVLFPAMAQKNESLAEGILAEFVDHHEMFRSMLRQVDELCAAGDLSACQEVLEKYCHSLLDHIAAEDDEIFPMAESLFSETELQNLGYRFEDADRTLGVDKKKSLEEWISEHA